MVLKFLNDFIKKLIKNSVKFFFIDLILGTALEKKLGLSWVIRITGDFIMNYLANRKTIPIVPGIIYSTTKILIIKQFRADLYLIALEFLRESLKIP